MIKKEVKAILSDPKWEEYFNLGNGKISGPDRAYALVPIVFRCLQLRCDALSSVPLNLYKRGKDDKVPWQDLWPAFSPSDWTWDMAAALTLKGAAYSIKLRANGIGKVQGLQTVNPFAVTVETKTTTDAKTGAKGVDILFRAPDLIGGSRDGWTRDEICYIKMYNPTNDVLPGPSPMAVGLQDSNLIYYMTRFLSKFFEDGAMPVTILSVSERTSDDEITRFQGLFKRALQGLKNAWSVMVLRGGDKMAPFKLTPDIKDMTIPTLEDRARRAFAAAMGIPQTMIEDAANFATAKEHSKQFWTATERPLGIRIQSALNRDVLWPMGYEARYDFDEMDVFQEDENERATSLAALVNAGMDLITACEILGYKLTDDQMTRIAEKISAPAPAAQPAQPVEVAPSGAATRSALFNWKAAALKALKSGHAADIDFDNPAIPETVEDAIHEGLQNSTTPEQVHELFAEAKEWIHTPLDHARIEAQLQRANELLGKVSV